MASGLPRELLTTGEMGEADGLAIREGTPGILLMERAGQAVAQHCGNVLRAGDRPKGTVAVLCGPGNNGGDGFVAARLLREDGHRVRLGLLGDTADLRGDAALAATAWSDIVEAPVQIDLSDVDLIVDALFGAGLTRPLDHETQRLVARINAAGVPVVSVDVPSGIDGNSGQEMGASVCTTVTVTFFRAKPGHYLYPGAARCGRLVVADIGIADKVLDVVKPRASLNVPESWLARYPWPAENGHKYKRGHAVVVSGGPSHTGAARMSSRAALRIGAGLVTLASPTEALAVNAAHLTAIMLRACDGAADLSAILVDRRKNVVVLGPGLGIGETTRSLVQAVLRAPEGDRPDAPSRSLVLDADALTSFEGQALALAGHIEHAQGPVVITPHDGEFARLFSNEPAVTQPVSKLERARAAAALLGCVVLLKGADTVVAEPDGRTSVSAGDSPWLATAGSGDVLAGLIGGLLAQGMPPFEAASAAVWLHVAAARRFGPGLIAEDLAETLPAVLTELYALAQARETSNQQRRPATL